MKPKPLETSNHLMTPVNLDEIGRRLVGEFSDRSWSEICPRHFRFNPVRRHDAARRRLSGAS